ncbi:alcohol dehydrogenase catalytic domain-containing protein [Peribacillus frigoritolerans]|uniref:alcohol dehydrogenase catalytic domain-containing protein n=1 Tax=Peribacillus frigoritolerans TaxID=450367 RepID=UPI003F80CFE1
MKAAVLTKFNKPLEILNVPDPELTPDGVIVKVMASGVCRSDLHLWEGGLGWVGLDLDLPHVMGHEFCGVIEEVGKDVTHFKKGDRVVVPFIHGCGHCETCNSGHPNVCADHIEIGITSWGGFGEYAHVPNADSSLAHLPEEISFVEAASLGCRFPTAYHGVVDQGEVRPGEWVTVFGCGGIGLSAIHTASTIGAMVIAVDINEEALKLAKAMGAAFTFNAKNPDVVKEIIELTKGGAHVTIDALGSKTTIQSAMKSLRIRGRHVQIGMTTLDEKGYVPVPIDEMIMKELRIIASCGIQSYKFASLIQMIRKGTINPGKMVTQTIGIEGAGQIILDMKAKKNVGVTIIDCF